jgi:uncharacterized membrane protein
VTNHVSDGAMDEVRAVRRAPGVILGLGFGGFADGIVLHQIVQWHNMGSAILPPTTMEAMKRNMMWDGWFHVATLVLCLAGVFMLLGLARRNHELPKPRMLVGQMLSGWGIFNLGEGIIDHHLLGLHHVRDMPVHVPLYDYLFLGLAGGGLILLGVGLARDNRPRGPV